MEITREEFELALTVIRKYREQIDLSINEVLNSDEKELQLINKEDLIYEIDIGPRLYNIIDFYFYCELNGQDIKNLVIKDLHQISLKRIKQYRGCGSKTIEELKKICLVAGVELKD